MWRRCLSGGRQLLTSGFCEFSDFIENRCKIYIFTKEFALARLEIVIKTISNCYEIQLIKLKI